MAKILIIEDEANIIDILSLIMQTAGHETIAAFGGEEGLQLAQEKLPDLILLDLMMPNVDGYEVIDRLKENSQTSSIPVIVITALIPYKPSEKLKLSKSNIADYVVKPFDTAVLVEKINKALERARRKKNG